MMLKRFTRWFVKSFVSLLLIQTTVFALDTKTTNINSDESQPIEIRSDSAEFDDKKSTAIYYGNVVMSQGSRQLACDTLTIERDIHGKIKLMIATGAPAKFQAYSEPEKPLSQGQANTVKYFPCEDKIVLTGNAEVFQNAKSIKAEMLTYFLTTRVLSSEAIPGKRTTVILTPKASKTSSKKPNPVTNP